MSFPQSMASILPEAVTPKLDSPVPGSAAYGENMEQDIPGMSLSTILPFHKHQGRMTQKTLPSATLEQRRSRGGCCHAPEVAGASLTKGEHHIQVVAVHEVSQATMGAD